MADNALAVQQSNQTGELGRPVLPYTPSDVEKLFINRVKKRVNIGSSFSVRWAQERNWYENILFYLGQQWLDYSTVTRRFQDLRTPRWFPKPVDNQIQPRAERLAAQFLKRRPTSRVRPNSNDNSDKEAARDGEALLGHIDDQVGEELLRHRSAITAVLTGTVISKEWFNPTAGPQMQIPRMDLTHEPVTNDVANCPGCGEDYPPEQAAQPCPTCGPASVGEPPALQPQQRQQTNPDGTPMLMPTHTPVMDANGQPVVDRFHLGEVESESVLPFEFYLDENADTLDGAQWCAQVTYRDLEWIDRNFPERGRSVGESSGSNVSSFYRAALLNVVGQNGPNYGTTGAGQYLRGGAITIEYEEMPTFEFPDGLLLIVAGEVLLYAGPLRIEGEFSFTDFRYMLVPGRYWGETPISSMIPLQRTINAIRSQLIINRKTILNPWILTPDGAGLVPGNVALRPGAVVPYQWTGMGTAPQIVPGTPLPNQIIDEWKMALESLDRIAGTEEVMQGDAPSGTKSGVALAQLGEQAETTHQPRMRRWEEFIAARGRKRLLLAQKHYKEDRLVKILGEGSIYTVRKLTGADLLGNTDVTVEAGSSLPRSRMAQLQLIMDAMQSGLLNIQEPGVREKILDEIGLTAIEPEMGPDRRKALVENDSMDQGVLPTQDSPFSPELASVGQWEDNSVHLREHMREVKDPRFAAKPPEAKAAYLEHIRQTRMAALQQMQLELQSQAPGGPEAPGGPQGGPPQGPAGQPGGGGGPESVAPSTPTRQGESSPGQPG